MTRYTTRSGDFAKDAIALKPFTTRGSLRGKDYAADSGILSAHALRTYNADRPNIDYVIYSYSTPIAWHTNDGQWTKVEDAFSNTTGKHQGALYRIPTDRTAGYRHNLFSDAQRALISKIYDSTHQTYIPKGQQKRTMAILTRLRAVEPVVEGTSGMYTLTRSVLERWR